MSLLHEHTTTTARDDLANTDVALLPTGSVEQHGPALPLGTDFMAAQAVAHTVSDREDVVCLPTIPVGVSEHHRQFDGTLWTAPETFENYIGDIVASIASHGVQKVVVVNGHGGNSGALQRVARRLRREEIAFAVPWNWWSGIGEILDDEFGVGITHADEIETSMLLAIAENLVREAALEDAEAGAGETWGKDVHGANVGFDTVDFSESGVVGHPTEGSKAAGERLLSESSEELDALIDWLCERKMADLWSEEHR
ncbi:creatinine amidohydrolase [Haladaptatus litoreus]|uniref:Creatinine amidohydrolase n=1 Tax=Haladaptatus litoreus TaxID=553468 RepID=A0A1N6WI53_9EURY|nr:creatininase family protein [Haladaptatus litoreus]SIQ89692.1 creatinine amidohydrolase [Haladaptatus litoreus]